MAGRAGEERYGTAVRSQNVILENRQRLSVSGVEEVLAFDENQVLMKTALGELVVRGEGLNVEKLAVESGDLSVTGEIAELAYPARSATLWERLFH